MKLYVSFTVKFEEFHENEYESYKSKKYENHLFPLDGVKTKFRKEKTDIHYHY